jgi:K+-transporting ATPase A subunit
MTFSTFALYAGFLLIVLVLVKPLGGYFTCVFAGERTLLDPAFRPVERVIYTLCGIDASKEMDGKQYALAFVIFTLAGTLLLYAILRLQQFLSFYDPVHLLTPLTPDLAMNTAISFSTTTTWQAYAGETTMSYMTQLVGLVSQNFLAGDGAHPYENLTTLTNVLEMLSIAVIPAALTNTFGRMVGRPRQGWLLFWVMVFLFVVALGLGTWAEQSGNPALASTLGASQPKMEGKEVRFGVSCSILAAVTTSNGATGSTNSAHDSYMPLGGAVPLTNMFLGEMIFGGLGTGIYSILMVALLGLFLTGLMIGRTPEYLGKRIEPPEMKLLAIYTLVGPVSVLALTTVAVVTAPGLAGLTTNSGPHGLTEILYAYTSSFANNGTTAVAMLLGRFGLAIPALALSGLFAQQTSRPMTPGKLRTDSLLFASVIIGTAIIVVALTYLPALALGPIVEHLLLQIGG